MNILHHKSWHVYSQKNKDKVQEDEAKAAVEEKKKEVERTNKERADRLSELRKRASSRFSSTIHPEPIIEPSYSYKPNEISSHSHLTEPVEKDLYTNKKPKYANQASVSSLSNYGLVSMLKEENSKRASSPEILESEETPHPLETYDLQKDLLKNLSTEMDLLEKKKEALKAPKKNTIPVPAITNTFLTKHNDPTPWYIHKDDNETTKKSSSNRFKDFNDPLRDIKKELSIKPFSQNKPEKKYSYSSNPSQDMESLRAQRISRESQERERERKLLSEVYSKQEYGNINQSAHSKSASYRKDSTKFEDQSYASKSMNDRKKKSKSKKKKSRHSEP